MVSTWCSKHVEAWNKLIVKQKFWPSSWLNTEINLRIGSRKSIQQSVAECFWKNSETWKVWQDERTKNIPTGRDSRNSSSSSSDRVMWGDMSRGTRIKQYCSVHNITITLSPFMHTVFNPSAWGHLNPSSYCDVGRLFYGVFQLWSKLKRKKCRNNF